MLMHGLLPLSAPQNGLVVVYDSNLVEIGGVGRGAARGSGGHEKRITSIAPLSEQAYILTSAMDGQLFCWEQLAPAAGVPR